MKKMINYYYKLYPNKIYKRDKDIYFFCDNDKYYIKKMNNKEKIDCYKDLYLYLHDKNLLINEIVYNKDNNYITNYENITYYILKCKGVESLIINIEDIIKYNVFLEENIASKIDFNEIDSMKKEVDYYETLFSGYNDEYREIQDIFNYFIGISENAISYLNDTIKECEHTMKVLSHKSINKQLTYKSLIDPSNINNNYKIKDIAEYIRILLINDLNWYAELDIYLSKVQLKEFDYRCLYAVILYPKYFFDFIDSKNKNKEILNRMINDLEKKLNKVYELINNYCKIPPIWWINKEKN